VEHDAIHLRRDFKTVIDAGANRGQFAVFAARRFPEAAIICFEPLPEPLARLRQATGNSPRVTLHDIALAETSGLAEFHVSVADDSSSLLPITPLQRTVFPGTEEQATRTVQIRRLDDVLRGGALLAPVLLKIDVQGGELGVLRGADDLMPSIDAVLVEVSFVELYAGQALADEVWSHLSSRGFSCRGAWSTAYGPRGECLQSDLLFARFGFDPLGE
jgi:FkbM family methyltransferase